MKSQWDNNDVIYGITIAILLRLIETATGDTTFTHTKHMLLLNKKCYIF